MPSVQPLGFRFEVTKTYPPWGPLQQFRVAKATRFSCFRCGHTKTAKLVSVVDHAPEKKLCNACYGNLLSVFEIKQGPADSDERSTMLAAVLLRLFRNDVVRRQEDLLRLREARARLLNERTLRFTATAQCVAETLKNVTALDWSAAVIGLCKAVEHEFNIRVVEAVRSECAGRSLSPDLNDKDFGRLARYCSGGAPTPPELGAVRHALETAANSVQRAASSELVQAIRRAFARWPRADWLMQPTGALSALDELSRKFRNRAAHVDELTQADFAACNDLVLGPHGLLWRLVEATST